MVECEYSFAKFCYKLRGVLIDTWWNVNSCHDALGIPARRCFNRYMVECECIVIENDQEEEAAV